MTDEANLQRLVHAERFAEQQVAHPAPALGQHSDEILTEVGLSPDEIAALHKSGAVP